VRSSYLADIKTVVVKIGTSSISEDDILSEKKLGKIVSDIVKLKDNGYNVIVVTSGAVSAGAGSLGLERISLTIPQRQAYASVGQPLLINAYRAEFEKYGHSVGQILLTEDDLRNRRRYLNARNTINALLELGVVPIINENDSVVVKEIKIGDNDTLSAHVLSVVNGELLILLSDIDGFYMDLEDFSPVSEIFEINDDIKSRAGGSGSIHGTGGMATKVNAAEMIMRIGGIMVIADGSQENVLARVLTGENIGTLFVTPGKALSSRKGWISMRRPNGVIVIDKGAAEAIVDRKKSLLPSGITAFSGEFDMGDVVEIRDHNSLVIGKGITNYNSAELDYIKGKKTSEIKTFLGMNYYDEVINRDDLIIMNEN